MSLGLTLNNALSGLRASQQALAVLSQNVANANNKDYTRQSVVQSALNVGAQEGNGVEVTGISRQIDQYIARQATTLSSGVAKAKTISDFYSQAQTYMGQPGAKNSIDSYTNNFFGALSTLAGNVGPADSSLKLAAVSSATALSGQISGLANNLQNLRLNADTQIGQTVNEINNQLTNIHNLNVAILSAKNNGSSVNGLQDQADAALKSIAGNIDISYSTNDDGTISVSTSKGQQLVSGVSLYKLSYTPVTDASQLADNVKLAPLTVQGIDGSGKPIGYPIALATGDTSDKVVSSLTGGKLSGLLDVRDHLIPDTLKQLDNMAASLRDAVNAIHNNGVSFPPAKSLTGQTMVNAAQSTSWNGSVMIAALDASGNPVTSPYASDVAKGVGIAPLKIDLSKLDSGSGAGKPSMQSIINQINGYYGVPQPKAKLGGLDNIQLISRTDALTAGSGTFNFDINLSNLSGSDSTAVITGATISGGGSITTSIPTSTYTAATGSNANIPFSVNMAAAGAGPYTVTVNVSTTKDGVTTSGLMTYNLNNASKGLDNDAYAAATASGSATIENPTTNKPILVAKMVDANGAELPKDPMTGDYMGSGYLKISGASGDNRVGINELDSSDQGIGNLPATGQGFSQYYGLNNFFNSNGSTANAAANLSVRTDISNNPEGMSLGQLKQSSASTNGTPKYTFEVGSGSNDTISALSSLATKTVNFKAAGSLPSVGQTFSGYAAQILGINASQAASASDNLNQTTLIQQGFADKDDSTRGVNIDEEMANTIVYQNAYTANARVINVTKDLFQSLLDAFN